MRSLYERSAKCSSELFYVLSNSMVVKKKSKYAETNLRPLTLEIFQSPWQKGG